MIKWAGFGVAMALVASVVMNSPTAAKKIQAHSIQVTNWRPYGARVSRASLQNEQIHVDLNGKQIAEIPVSWRSGVMMISLAHLLPLFRELGWQPDYQSNKHQLFLRIYPFKITKVPLRKGNFSLYIDGRLYQHMELGGAGASFFAWMNTLNELGVQNGWNPGKSTWTISTAKGTEKKQASSGQKVTSDTSTGAASTTQTASSIVSPTSVLNTENSNAHTNDQSDWQQASRDFFISAQTNLPGTTGTPTSLFNATTGQTLYLFAYSDSMDVPNQSVTWQVNSPDATVTTNSQAWKLGTHQVTEATFIASKPGIYTVQAEMNGIFSVPLVLTIGLTQLNSTPFAVSNAQMGIEGLPAGLPTVASTTQAGVTYIPFQAQQNWIPISGFTNLSVPAMNVILTDTNGQLWTYRLPVVNGQFSGSVLSPFTGNVTVTLFPHYFQAQTQSVEKNSGYSYPNSSYTVNVSGNALDTLGKALLTSAQRDYNMSPQFAQTASLLLENSPTMDTAIAAISNYTSESIIYNQQELQTVNYRWQDALTAWQSGTGVCEDYASLAAALLDSVGIPTQTVGGWANGNWTTPPASDSNAADAHEWDQSWDGSQWIVFDPTWNTDDSSSVAHYLTNEFFTNTTSMQAEHLPDPNQTGQAS